jgi:hypothetical protein
MITDDAQGSIIVTSMKIKRIHVHKFDMYNKNNTALNKTFRHCIFILFYFLRMLQGYAPFLMISIKNLVIKFTMH